MIKVVVVLRSANDVVCKRVFCFIQTTHVSERAQVNRAEKARYVKERVCFCCRTDEKHQQMEVNNSEVKNTCDNKERVCIIKELYKGNTK